MSGVNLVKETSERLYSGHVTVGTTAARLSSASFPLNRGVLLRCPGSDDSTTNIAPVWIGGNDVVAGSGTNGGMPIVPGASIFIPIDDLKKLWVVSTVADQDLAYVAL
jgi:hypothetical protein